MARKPKGSYTRSTPDWFLYDLCMGGWYDNVPANPTYAGISLFNEGQTSDLHVYSLNYMNSGSDVMAVTVQKSVLGSRVNGCFPVNPNGRTPAAGIYLDHYGAAAPPFVTQNVPANTQVVLGTAGLPAWGTPNHPLFIIPPGWSVRLTADAQANIWGVGFWFVVI